MQLRKKADRFNYTKAGEKISGPAVMQFLGKIIPTCYVSGDAAGVLQTPVPFDMNTDNVLPSNMAYLSERYLKGDPLTMALVFSEITHNIGDLAITLSFLSPGYAVKKVTTHGKELLKKLDDQNKQFPFTEETSNPLDFDMVYAIWDALMFEGLKGMNILKVTDSHGLTLSVDAPLANQYFLTKTAIRAQAFQNTGPVAQQAKPGLNLIK